MMARTLSSLLLVVVAASTAQAQDSHWGIGGSFAPQWRFLDPLEEILGIDSDLAGQEFRIGIVRGRDLSGDWGVMLVQKRVSDNRSVQLHETVCLQGTGAELCTRGAFHLTRGASVLGAEIYKFIPFGTIKRRAQIGLLVGGGVGQLRGQTARSIEHLQVSGGQLTSGIDEVATGPFRDILPDVKVFPLARLEAAVAFIAAPGVKLRFSGGFSMPGTQVFSVQAHYLFGAQ